MCHQFDFVGHFSIFNVMYTGKILHLFLLLLIIFKGRELSKWDEKRRKGRVGGHGLVF